MKYAFLTIFYFSTLSLFCQIDDKDLNFRNLFKKKDTIILSPPDDFERTDLPRYITFKYICDIKNKCEVNFHNNRPYFYYPLSLKEERNFFIASILRTDSYKKDIYLISIFKNTSERIEKLHVFSNVYPNISSLKNKDSIQITRKLNIECNNNSTGCYKLIKTNFKIDKEFKSIEKSNKKRSDIIDFEKNR